MILEIFGFGSFFKNLFGSKSFVVFVCWFKTKLGFGLMWYIVFVILGRLF